MTLRRMIVIPSLTLAFAFLRTCYGTCQDHIADCAEYGQAACQPPYDSWARKNCPLFCGFCSSTCSDSLSDCADYGKGACLAPYLTWAKTNCASYCGLCSKDGSIVTTAPTVATTTTLPATLTSGSCSYKGKVYAVGETWLDGCEYRCTCASSGLTQCTPPCVQYSNLPSNCNEETVLGQCCKRITCSVNGTLGGPDTISLDQGCRYKNKNYTKGQTWQDGCDYRCTCERNDIVQCSTLCNVYKNLPSSCHYETVPGECCKKVVCSVTGTGISAGVDKCVYKNNTYSVGETWSDGCEYDCTCLKGLTTHCATKCNEFNPLPPSCHYEVVPGQCCRKLVCLNTTTSSLIDRGGCTYKTQKYQTGETWQDGCAINCTCLDSRTGRYDCKSACPNVQLSDGCSLVKKTGNCCPEAVCDIPNVNTTNVFSSDFQGCVYKDGSIYQLGDMWYDGCEWKCYCQQSKRYNCESRCMGFHLPSVCTLEAPPAGKCCQVPKCPPNYIINLPPGYIPE